MPEVAPEEMNENHLAQQPPQPRPTARVALRRADKPPTNGAIYDGPQPGVPASGSMQDMVDSGGDMPTFCQVRCVAYVRISVVLLINACAAPG